jgi:hypothetical protein
MIRVCSLTKYVLFCFVLSQLYVFSQFSGGNGTELSPYQISNVTDLIELHDSLESIAYTNLYKYYILTNDLEDTLYTPLIENDGGL